MDFEDGNRVEFTNDARTVYEIVSVSFVSVNGSVLLSVSVEDDNNNTNNNDNNSTAPSSSSSSSSSIIDQVARIINTNQVQSVALASISNDSNEISNSFNSSTSKVTAVISVRASFPSAYPGISARLNVSIVVVDQVRVFSERYPVASSIISSINTIGIHELRRVHCSDEYQRAIARIVGRLSDGVEVFVISSSSLSSGSISISSSNSSVVSIVNSSVVSGSSSGSGGQAGFEVIGVSVGESVISATFGGVSSTLSSSTSLVMQVLDEATLISSVNLVTAFTQNTFRDVFGASRLVQVNIGFDDGSLFEDVLGSSSTNDWVDITQLLVFSSNVSNSLTVSNVGVMRLIANHFEAVGITATSVTSCIAAELLPPSPGAPPPPFASSQLVFCNLIASSDGEVDLGNEFGRPVDAIVVSGTSSSEIRVDVRLRSSSSVLSAFQVKLVFDDSVLVASGCSVGSQWTGEFDCTLNDPSDEVLLVGSSSSSTAQGIGIHIASVTLRGVIGGSAGGLFGLSGFVEKAESVQGALGRCSVFSPCLFGPAGEQTVEGISSVVKTT